MAWQETKSGATAPDSQMIMFLVRNVHHFLPLALAGAQRPAGEAGGSTKAEKSNTLDLCIVLPAYVAGGAVIPPCFALC
ncbi:MAG: hypothetical protein IJR28_06090 [Ottowia sp.]|nr:hypothetical protein [Ottowia sp.]